MDKTSNNILLTIGIPIISVLLALLIGSVLLLIINVNPLEAYKYLIFGNFTRDVKSKFDAIKYEIKTNAERLTSQEAIVNHQTSLINMLNKEPTKQPTKQPKFKL